QQILYNLMSNAIKFTPEGNITIRLESATVYQGISDGVSLPATGWLKDGEWVIICVTDTGIGIQPEYQSRIFEHYSQLDSGYTREQGGIGLGLTITQKLVEMHE